MHAGPVWPEDVASTLGLQVRAPPIRPLPLDGMRQQSRHQIYIDAIISTACTASPCWCTAGTAYCAEWLAAKLVLPLAHTYRGPAELQQSTAGPCCHRTASTDCGIGHPCRCPAYFASNHRTVQALPSRMGLAHNGWVLPSVHLVPYATHPPHPPARMQLVDFAYGGASACTDTSPTGNNLLDVSEQAGEVGRCNPAPLLPLGLAWPEWPGLAAGWTWRWYKLGAASGVGHNGTHHDAV